MPDPVDVRFNLQTAAYALERAGRLADRADGLPDGIVAVIEGLHKMVAALVDVLIVAENMQAAGRGDTPQ